MDYVAVATGDTLEETLLKIWKAVLLLVNSILKKNVKGLAGLCYQIFIFVPTLQFELHRTWDCMSAPLHQIFMLVPAFEIDADLGRYFATWQIQVESWCFPYWALTLSFATRDCCLSTPPDLNIQCRGQVASPDLGTF